MPVTVNCSCKKPYRVKDELAGRTIKCPYCGQAVNVSAQVDPPPFDDPYGDETPSDYSRPYEESPPQFPSAASDFRSDRFGSATDSPQLVPELNDTAFQTQEPEIPGYTTGTDASPKSRVNVSSVLAGLGMMVGGAVWGLALLVGGGFDFYPIVLFVFGLISFVKGLAGAE